jgi:hypothetical protein
MTSLQSEVLASSVRSMIEKGNKPTLKLSPKKRTSSNQRDMKNQKFKLKKKFRFLVLSSTDHLTSES